MHNHLLVPVRSFRTHLLVALLLVSRATFGQFDDPTLYTSDGSNRVTISWLGSDGGDGVHARINPYSQTSSFIHIDGTSVVDRNEGYSADGGDVLFYHRLASPPNGGIMAGGLYYEDMPSDSAYAEVRISRIGADGNFMWTSTARTNFWTVPTSQNDMGLAVGPSGEAFVVGGATLRDLVFKFDATGSHIWTQWIHPGSFLRATHVISDGAGGCYVGCHYSGTNEPFELIHLNSDGELVSSNTYTYGSTTSYLEVYDMALASNGDVIVAGSNNVLGASNYYFILRTAPDGQVLWYNFYTMDQIVPTHWTGGGVLAADNGDIWFNDEHALFRTSSEGEGSEDGK